MKKLYKLGFAVLVLSMLTASCKDCNECEVYVVSESDPDSLDSLSYVYPAICGRGNLLSSYEKTCKAEYEDIELSEDGFEYKCVCHELD